MPALIKSSPVPPKDRIRVVTGADRSLPEPPSTKVHDRFVLVRIAGSEERDLETVSPVTG